MRVFRPEPVIERMPSKLWNITIASFLHRPVRQYPDAQVRSQRSRHESILPPMMDPMTDEQERFRAQPAESETYSGARLIGLIVAALSGLLTGIIIGALLF
jgi:hypothetical protein